jgi:hypothetical protein
MGGDGKRGWLKIHKCIHLSDVFTFHNFFVPEKPCDEEETRQASSRSFSEDRRKLVLWDFK